MNNGLIEWINYSGDLVFLLREYPVSEVLIVYTLSSMDEAGEILE